MGEHHCETVENLKLSTYILKSNDYTEITLFLINSTTCIKTSYMQYCLVLAIPFPPPLLK